MDLIATGDHSSPKNWVDLLIYGNLQGIDVTSSSLCQAVSWRGREVYLRQGRSQDNLFISH